MEVTHCFSCPKVTILLLLNWNSCRRKINFPSDILALWSPDCCFHTSALAQPMMMKSLTKASCTWFMWTVQDCSRLPGINSWDRIGKVKRVNRFESRPDPTVRASDGTVDSVSSSPVEQLELDWTLTIRASVSSNYSPACACMLCQEQRHEQKHSCQHVKLELGFNTRGGCRTGAIYSIGRRWSHISITNCPIYSAQAQP